MNLFKRINKAWKSFWEPVYPQVSYFHEDYRLRSIIIPAGVIRPGTTFTISISGTHSTTEVVQPRNYEEFLNATKE